MVIMDAFYNPDRLQDIWQNIDKLHLSYLEMEESPEKLEHRNKLEDCIRDFLCLAAHNEKFSFRQTAEVLYRSANSKKDFSGYKAATGFNALQLYAGNLLSQPWRKEYKTIKTYCGFYKHQIEANLVGAEILFEVMGYKHFGDGILVLEGPICPDTVTNVSKDCLIAYVECQILKMIWEEVSQNFNITWLDILDFRQNHICSGEHSIRALNYQYQQRQYHQEHNNHSYPSQSDLYISRCQQNNVTPILHSNHSFPPSLPTTTNHHNIPSMENPTPYIYGTNNRCCINNYANYVPQYYPIPYPPPPPPPQTATLVKPPLLKTNGYYCTNGYIPQNIYGYGVVPTGQLIELDHHHHNTNNYDVIDGGRSVKYRQNNDIIKTKINQRENGENNCKNDIQYEDWDYVYRNLESLGYSKDLGERGDILKETQQQQQRKTTKNTNLDETFNNLTIEEQQPLKQKQQRKAKSTNSDDVINNLYVDDRPLKISEALIRYEDNTSKYNNNKETIKLEQPHQQRHTSPGSSYENLSLDKKKKNKLIKENNKKFDIKKGKNKIKTEIKWQCKACTYINDNSFDICEMCSKSKINIEQEMEIGGAECSKCTLVNPRDMKVCQACGESLKDSPTYI